jgi:hypothetical protein
VGVHDAEEAAEVGGAEGAPQLGSRHQVGRFLLDDGDARVGEGVGRAADGRGDLGMDAEAAGVGDHAHGDRVGQRQVCRDGRPLRVPGVGPAEGGVRGGDVGDPPGHRPVDREQLHGG